MATILIVEDDEQSREVLARRLSMRGHSILFAEDGVEALEKARTLRPDVVLMDISLPQLDGSEASRTLKADPATRSIPVIMLMGHALPGEEAFYRDEARADDCVAKPVDFAQLLEKIERVVKPAGG